MNLNIFAQKIQPKQIEPNNKSKAYKFAEFNTFKQKGCRQRFMEFTDTLLDENSKGVVLLYGSNNKKMESEFLKWCSEYRRIFAPPYQEFVRAGFRKKQKVEFWVVPEGAESPIVKKQEK